MKKRILFSFFIIMLAFSLSGCISFNSGQEETGNPGGVFISGDKGETWVRKVDLMTPGAEAALIAETGDVNVANFTFDPTDSRYLYMGTVEHGLFYSKNNGKGWVHDETINSGFVRDLAIDPKNSCIIYAAVNTRLMKTANCGRSWEEVYKIPVGQLITAVAVDFFNTEILYIGLGTGDFLKSIDKGVSWERIKNFPSRVNVILTDKDDSRHIYVGTEKSYLYRTTDAGANWDALKDNFKDFKGTNRAVELLQDQQNGSLYYVAESFILRSTDQGESWQEVKLVTTPSKTSIFSAAINLKNGNELYYATPTNLYRSLDRGNTWSTWRLPTKRTGRALAVHPEDSNVIYLGVRLYEE